MLKKNSVDAIVKVFQKTVKELHELASSKDEQIGYSESQIKMHESNRDEAKKEAARARTIAAKIDALLAE